MFSKRVLSFAILLLISSVSSAQQSSLPDHVFSKRIDGRKDASEITDNQALQPFYGQILNYQSYHMEAAVQFLEVQVGLSRRESVALIAFLSEFVEEIKLSGIQDKKELFCDVVSNSGNGSAYTAIRAVNSRRLDRYGQSLDQIRLLAGLDTVIKIREFLRDKVKPGMNYSEYNYPLLYEHLSLDPVQNAQEICTKYSNAEVLK